MKKSFRILAAGLAAILALASCDKESYSQSDNTGSSNGTRIITVSFSPESTRTVLDSDGKTPKFKEGDVILVSDGTSRQECTVKVKDGVGSIETSLTEASLTAVYPAKAAKLSGNAITGIKVASSQSGKFEDANICMATIEKGATEAEFENQTALFHFVLEAGTGYTAKKLLVKSIGETPAAIADDDATEITIGDGTKTVEGVYMAVLPGVKISDLVVGAGNGRRYLNRKADGTAVDDSKIVINCKYDVNIPVLKGHEYVELIIPVIEWEDDYSGYEKKGSETTTLKWATTNVGATIPTEYGDYFAWGANIGHKLIDGWTTCWDGDGYLNAFAENYSFSWANCPFATTDNPTFSKYVPKGQTEHLAVNFEGDTLTELDSDDDAATANWGSNWRMPTKKECAGLAELSNIVIENKGYTFTDANGNSIFLPAAGYGVDQYLLSADVMGYYWTSSLMSVNSSNAYFLHLSTIAYANYNRRCDGFSVRPVSE